VTLPSTAGGLVTHEVGYIDAPPDKVAAWLRDRLGVDWSIRPADWDSLAQAVADLAPSPTMTRNAVVPVDGWTLILTNGPTGTDVGMVPSLAARELGCRAVRAVSVGDDEGEFPARVMEVFGPDGSGPLLARRAIVSANDGGEWVFETTGEPFAFERMDQYTSRRKSRRFTPELLYEYLRRLDVPIDAEPDWARARIIELRVRS
jgi:hypothetical protein